MAIPQSLDLWLNICDELIREKGVKFDHRGSGGRAKMVGDFQTGNLRAISSAAVITTVGLIAVVNIAVRSSHCWKRGARKHEGQRNKNK